MRGGCSSATANAPSITKSSPSIESPMALADELRQLLSNDAIADDPETLAAHSGDKWFAAEAPEVVVFARSTSDVSKLLKFASQKKIPVTARGAGFGYVGGCVPAKKGIALSLMRMNRIKEINFADAIATVEPGVITADLKAAARAQKLFYPPDRATLSADFATMSQTAAAVQEIFAKGFLPASVEIADGFTLEAARKDLGQAIGPPGNAHLLIDLDGQEESVRSEAEAIRQLLADKKPNALEMATGEENCEKLWELRRQFSNSLRATGLTKLNQDVVVPRSHIADLVEFAERLHTNYGFPIACFGHAGDGNIHVNIMADRYNRDAAVREKVERALDELFAQVLAWGGVITGEHGIGLAKKRWWPDATSEPVRELHRKLKSILDPNGILNPGKFIE